uniref:Uncharacterized protein n=1 Tax=viral metagenome TaxID=1070528 RepID=A0A6C0BUA1_9ZZZZ
MPKTKANRKKTNKKVRFAKLRITRKLRSRRRRNQPKVRDCSWMNLPMTKRGGGDIRPAEMPAAYGPIREVIPVVGKPAMYLPETGAGSYYGYNTNPSLPDPVASNDYFRKGMIGGSILPRDLVDLGRNTMNSIQRFYGTLTSQPVSESPNVMDQPIGEKTNVIMPQSSLDLENIL